MKMTARKLCKRNNVLYGRRAKKGKEMSTLSAEKSEAKSVCELFWALSSVCDKQFSLKIILTRWSK